MDNKKLLSNENNLYCAHGMGGLKDENIIFDTGLRFSHGTLEYTVVELGEGHNNLYDEHVESFNNWPHKNSEKIIIVSLPKIFKIHASYNWHNGYIAFAYKNLDNGNLFLKPEFILGCYDSKTGKINLNERYYEKIDLEKQKELFSEIKNNYAREINAVGSSVQEYKDVYGEIMSWGLPLNDVEITSYDKMYKEFRENEINQTNEHNGNGDEKIIDQWTENENNFEFDEGWSR